MKTKNWKMKNWKMKKINEKWKMNQKWKMKNLKYWKMNNEKSEYQLLHYMTFIQMYTENKYNQNQSALCETFTYVRDHKLFWFFAIHFSNVTINV